MYQCITIIFLSTVLQYGISGSRIIKGPYESTITYLRPCDKKEIKEFTSPHKDYGTFVVAWPQVYNCSDNTCLGFNITIIKPVYNVKIRVRGFSWRTNAWKLTERIPELGCHTYIIRLFTRMLNIKVDDKTCVVPKISIAVKNLDYDLMYHAWQMDAEYGRSKWIYEALSNGKTLYCMVGEFIISAKKKTE